MSSTVERVKTPQTRIDVTRIIGTPFVVYSAWERTTGNHHTVTYSGDHPMGRIGSDRFYGAPANADRVRAVNEHYAGHYERAYTAILAKYPALARIPHRRDMGEIEIVLKRGRK